MSRPRPTSAAALDLPGEAQPRLETTSRTSVLITEHEVVFGTAAAVPNTTRSWIRALLTAAQPRPARYRPARYRYLESALMAREMQRL